MVEGAGEVGIFHVGASENRCAKRCSPEIRPGQIGIGKVARFHIGMDNGIFERSVTKRRYYETVDDLNII